MHVAADTSRDMPSAQAAEAWTGAASGFAFFGIAFTCFYVIRSCAGKTSARERSMRELGEPLAPEAQAELGAAGVAGVACQAPVVPVAKVQPSPVQAYLDGLYLRAAYNVELMESEKMAKLVLRDVYTVAMQRAC
ncbi:unnamed protein product [Effrenium voratum]|nr:unnamed protein product [Effrenium voratum]